MENRDQPIRRKVTTLELVKAVGQVALVLLLLVLFVAGIYRVGRWAFLG